jgi:hypothetical protein
MRTFLQQRLAEKEMGSRLDSELRKSSRAGSFRVRIRMRVRRDRVSGLELAQHYHSAGAFVLVQNHQLNPFIGTGLPSFVFGQRDVGKHDFTEAGLVCRNRIRPEEVVLARTARM